MTLVAACCRWPGGAMRDDIVQAAASGVDWASFGRLLVRHRVVVLAHHALAAAGVIVPDDLTAQFEREVERTARRNVRLARQSLALQDGFAAAGIPAIVIKGAALGQLAYGNQTIKHAKDIDMLVRPAQALAAIGVAQGLGYRLTLPRAELDERQWRDVLRHGREVTLVHGPSGVPLELHWRLTDNPRLLSGLDPGGATDAVSLGDGGPVLRTLPRQELFAYLCVHGAAHGWARLKWLADVAALLSHEDADGIERLHGAAQAMGVGEAAGQTLVLAERLLGLTLPQALSRELSRCARVSGLAAVAINVLAGSLRFGQARLIRARLMLSRDTGDWMAMTRAHLTAIEDVLAVPLPPRLHWLYVPLRLPMWLGRRVRATVMRQ